MASGDSRALDGARAAHTNEGVAGGRSGGGRIDYVKLNMILSREPDVGDLIVDSPPNNGDAEKKREQISRMNDTELNENVVKYTNLTKSVSMKDGNQGLKRYLSLIVQEKEKRDRIRLKKDGKEKFVGAEEGGNTPSASPKHSSALKPVTATHCERTLSGGLAGPSCQQVRTIGSGSQSTRVLRSGTKEISRGALPLPSNSGEPAALESSDRDWRSPGCVAIGQSLDTAMELFSSDEEDAGQASVSPNNSRPGNFQSRRPGLRSSVACTLDSQKIAYPSRDDPDAIEVLSSDLERLAPFQFLNDTIIDFYIKFIQRPEWKGNDRERFHFFNSFFYKKLSDIVNQRPKKGETKESKDSKEKEILKLRKWTKGTNIFEKAYLFVPIHDNLHWSLAIICLPPSMSDGAHYDPCIFHLDSMLPGHNSQPIFRALRTYLVAEWKHRDEKELCGGDQPLNKKLKISVDSFQAKRLPVPQQENESDCGLFLLHYIERFINDAPPNLRWSDFEEVKEKMFGRKWFDPQDASSLRQTIQGILEGLFEADKALVGSCSEPVPSQDGEEQPEVIVTGTSNKSTAHNSNSSLNPIQDGVQLVEERGVASDDSGKETPEKGHKKLVSEG